MVIYYSRNMTNEITCLVRQMSLKVNIPVYITCDIGKAGIVTLSKVMHGSESFGVNEEKVYKIPHDHWL